VAFVVPLVLGLFPAVRLPSVVLEILAGIVIGPSVLAIAVSLLLKATGLIETPLLIAIILCATSLGILVPVPKDSGEISSTFGQLIIAAGTIADFGAVILLSIFFSGEGGVGSTLLLIGILVVLGVVVFFTVRGATRSRAIRADLTRLQDTTAQIRIRGAVVLPATSLPFIVAATAIGQHLDLITAAEGAALIGAGLLSVLIFLIVGLSMLGRDAGSPESRRRSTGDADAEPMIAM
jgi:Kef-type K+ transport system membrane component KefB